MSKKPLGFRFRILRTDGFSSSIWMVWATKTGDVYASTRRFTGIQKVSFHQSGICRLAMTKEHGRPANLPDRLLHKWKREQPRPMGERSGSIVASIAFPSDLLSRLTAGDHRKLVDIPAAAPGHALIVELGYSREREQDIHDAFPTRVLFSVPLKNGETFFGIFTEIEWQNKTLSFPGKGLSQDLTFSAADPRTTGRPIRLTTWSTPKDGEAIFIQELGGYTVEDEPWTPAFAPPPVP